MSAMDVDSMTGPKSMVAARLIEDLDYILGCVPQYPIPKWYVDQLEELKQNMMDDEEEIFQHKARGLILISKLAIKNGQLAEKLNLAIWAKEDHLLQKEVMELMLFKLFGKFVKGFKKIDKELQGDPDPKVKAARKTVKDQCRHIVNQVESVCLHSEELRVAAPEFVHQVEIAQQTMLVDDFLEDCKQ